MFEEKNLRDQFFVEFVSAALAFGQFLGDFVAAVVLCWLVASFCMIREWACSTVEPLHRAVDCRVANWAPHLVI
jgi:hypothetical protein